MFNERKEKLKDFKKLIRIAKKIAPLAIERNVAQRNYMSGLEDYFKLQEDIKLLEDIKLKSIGAKAKLEKVIEDLKKSLEDLEQGAPITTEKEKAREKSNALLNEIKQYEKYIKSKAYNFSNLNLTPEEYKFCECDVLSIFIIVLIFKQVHKEMEEHQEYLSNPESILLDSKSVYRFRHSLFLTENDVRTALTKQLNEELETKHSTNMWEYEDDLLHFPIFVDLDFETFIKYLD